MSKIYITDIVNNMTTRAMVTEYLYFYDYQHFAAFDEMHKDQLIADLMRFVTIDECLLDDQSLTNALIGYLTTYDPDYEIDFLNRTKQFLYYYFGEVIDEVLEEEIMMRQAEEYREAGMHPVIDRVNGETIWRKL